MPSPRPLPVDLIGRPLSNAAAAQRGIGPDRLRRRDVSHPHHGVHVIGAVAVDLADRCRELLQVLDLRFVFSHLTAALLWGLPLPGPLAADTRLHVAAMGVRGRIRRPGVVGWEIGSAPPPARMCGDLPVVAPADVWAQLAGASTGRGRPLLDLRWIVAIADFLLTGDRFSPSPAPLCSIGELREAAARRRGKRGAKRLTEALELVRTGPHSVMESRLRVGLVQEGLPEPEVQPGIRTSIGIRHPDLGYVSHRVLLEFEGDHHRTSRSQWLTDLTRVQAFQDAGYLVIRVGEADIEPDCHALAVRVRRALRARENAQTGDG